MADAKCRDSDVSFFPTEPTGVEMAKAICYRCPVKGPCARYALDQSEVAGIWGGMSERQRRRVRLGKEPKPAWV